MVSIFKSNSQLGEGLNGSLPDITGYMSGTQDIAYFDEDHQDQGGALILAGAWGKYLPALRKDMTPTSAEIYNDFQFRASRSNSTYSASAGKDIVRPTSIGVSMWKRVL